LLFRSALRQGHREEVLVSALLLLTNTLQSSAEVLPALGLLSHNVRILPAELTGLVDAPTCDVVLLDGRHDLVHVRGLGRLIRTTGIEVPLVLVVTEGGLAVVAADWGFDDVVLDTAGPAEVEARLRLVTGRLAARRDGEPTEPNVIRTGEVVIDEATYTAKVGGKALDLTFKEFELLKFLAQHPGRVFSRQQLLQEVWGYDYFGGTRTVDVHVRRLRAKLGPEHDALIGTVRNVGYRFVLPVWGGDPAERPAQPGAGSAGPGARRAGAATPRRRMQP
jgi:DNA-binding response OmpR family regulator